GLPPSETRVGRMPEHDALLPQTPAQEDVAAFSSSGEIYQAGLGIAQDHAQLDHALDAVPERRQRVPVLLASLAAAVGRRGVGDRAAALQHDLAGLADALERRLQLADE